jgi:hypothetical protein
LILVATLPWHAVVAGIVVFAVGIAIRLTVEARRTAR